jgi:FKBP-type peptidyl-prolyl cis-trans isomerase
MSTQRVLASILLGLALAACSNSSGKPPEKPVAPPAATSTNPEFYLPPDSELTTTASGLKYKVLREGSGTPPTPSGSFTAHYCGWFPNGEVFDSSYPSGEPLSYPVNRMIPGWQEALVMMKPGAEYILVVPPELGYGAGGNGIPPNSTLVFRMELLAVSG